MAGAVKAGGHHGDAGGELPGRPPEGGGVDSRHRPGFRAADDRANAIRTPAPAHTEPPNRNHFPAPVFVITTLPPEVPMASTYAVTNQPTAGTSPPRGLRIPHAPSTQVTRISTSKASAATGTEPSARLYWKQPIRLCPTPSRNSMM